MDDEDNYSNEVDERSFNAVDCDSDNDAPEDVSFATGKATALKAAAEARDSVQQQNERLKQKRKNKQDFMEQQKLAKKKRLEELSSKELPIEVLESVSMTAMEKKERSECCVKRTEKDLPVECKSIRTSEDLIPLESSATEFRVKVINDRTDDLEANIQNLIEQKNKLMKGPSKRISSKEFRMRKNAVAMRNFKPLWNF